MERDMTDFFDEAFAGQPVVAILRGMSVERTVTLAERAWDLGIDLVEVTVQSEDGFPVLAAAVEVGERRGRLVGAGTVVSRAQLERVHAAGARFAVAPGLDLGLVEAAAGLGLPYLPGVATASEVQAATGAGVRHLKVFPAAVLGPGWFKTMAGPFPTARFVATGGVDATNARGYLDAGAVAVGVGSALEDDRQLPLLAGLIDGGRNA
jgi:2-dehydro-3-deoxyphosphogluconate aldolase/(4S)-4-hydroxy-2-oxoglutarate aldolase